MWLDNEQSSHTHFNERARDLFDFIGSKDAAVVDLEDEIRVWVEGANPIAGEASMFADLLGAALVEVSYREIAEHYMSDVEESLEEVEA